MLVACALAPARAQIPPVAPALLISDERHAGAPPSETGGLYRAIKKFDFDERAEGNFNEVPMYWERLTGDGLPRYSGGKFDPEVGHDAPPSFRLSLTGGGSAAYAYGRLDLPVVPESDYLITGYIRAKGLEHSRAFISAYLVDRYQQRLPGSEKISATIRSTGDDDEPWQFVQISVPNDFPDAFNLHIEVWLLQAYAWRESRLGEVDPIIRQDVYGDAWFDDITVFRLPRARLRFSDRGGLVRPGAKERFIIEVNRSRAQTLRAELTVTTPDDTPVFRRTIRLDGEPEAPGSAGGPDENARSGASIPVPDLPPGAYLAQLRLLGEDTVLLERDLGFSVLAALPVKSSNHPDLGVDIGHWPGGDTVGARELVRVLGAGAVKVSVPCSGPFNEPARRDYADAVQNLLRELAQYRVDATCVLISHERPTVFTSGVLQDIVGRDADWAELFAPVISHFAGAVNTWQLGADAIELRTGRDWAPDRIALIRRLMSRFITAPELVIPRAVTAVAPHDSDIQAVWVPAAFPTRQLVWQLGFLVEPQRSPVWLELEGGDPGLNDERSLIDLAQRIVLAKALGPDRLYVPAPFRQRKAGGVSSWQPTAFYAPLRTLFHALGGKRCIGVLAHDDSVTALVFQGDEDAVIVGWTWLSNVPEVPMALYLGSDASATDLWGNPMALERIGEKTRVTFGPAPIVIYNVDASLALFQASVSLDPDYVEVHTAEPKPVLRFRNMFDHPISGEVALQGPLDWQVGPATFEFNLAPGESREQPLALALPPRQLAARHELATRISIYQPDSQALDFSLSVMVGLKDVVLEAHGYFLGDDLVIEESLQNRSEDTVNFAGFCQPPGHARQECAFLNVAPGEISRQMFVFPRSSELRGNVAHVGIEEIRGRRRLDQLVELPRK